MENNGNTEEEGLYKLIHTIVDSRYEPRHVLVLRWRAHCIVLVPDGQMGDVKGRAEASYIID